MEVPRLRINRYLGNFSKLVALPIDSEDMRLQKGLIVGSSLLITLAGVLWGAMYLAFDESVAGAFPLAYSALSLISLALFVRTRRYETYRLTQLILILLLPFFLMIALGGFANSSAVILWSILCPFGAVLFARERKPPIWMGLYLGLLIAGGLLHPYLREVNNLPPPLVVPVFFVLNIGAVSGIAFLLLYYFVGERERAFGLLRNEQRRSEELLLNVLPAEIAPRLKTANRAIADYVESASVLFADIVGSTSLFAEMEPEDTVDWLNEIFSKFDGLVEMLGLEKVRTIGDNYMVASGAPRTRPDHAQVIALLGLEMCREIRELPSRNGKKIEVRVGINSGPLVAGVIGQTKFHYDLWGDTVNTASRMESHGKPGRVQITQSTYRLIREDFKCEPRGKIQVKGKGDMETWFVLSKNH